MDHLESFEVRYPELGSLEAIRFHHLVDSLAYLLLLIRFRVHLCPWWYPLPIFTEMLSEEPFIFEDSKARTFTTIHLIELQ